VCEGGFIVCDGWAEPLWNPVRTVAVNSSEETTRALAHMSMLSLDGEHWDEEVVPVEPGRIDLSAVQSLMYTSGTTGRPKGAMITHGSHFYGATSSAIGLGLDRRDVWLTSLPLFHVAGQAVLMRSVIYGTTALIHDRFDALDTLQAIAEHRVTLMSVVSVMLADLLQLQGDRRFPEYLRCVLLGGGPAPQPQLEACLRIGLLVSQSYGLTESNSQAVTLLPGDALRKLGSAGKPLLGNEVRIVLDEMPAPAGEIALRGPTLTTGYWRRPQATAETLREGWLHTGDLGYLDAEGFLYVLDRRNDLIISGGENIYPAEIEAVLLAHLAVREAGVIGMPDERFGAHPVAVVSLSAAAKQTTDLAVLAEQLQAFCQERLAHYKVPAQIVFIDSLPRNAAGKLLRRELYAWFS